MSLELKSLPKPKAKKRKRQKLEEAPSILTLNPKPTIAVADAAVILSKFSNQPGMEIPSIISKLRFF